MRKKRHTVEQSTRILRQVNEGIDIKQTCPKHNIPKALSIVGVGNKARWKSFPKYDCQILAES
jgi:hypothetical protein